MPARSHLEGRYDSTGDGWIDAFDISGEGQINAKLAAGTETIAEKHPRPSTVDDMIIL